jgi:hypothetical protein
MKGTAETYRVFVRNWWRWEYSKFGEQWRTGGIGLTRRLVPDPGARKTTIATRCTENETRAICMAHAATHKPGPLSRKAEYERE